MKKYVNPKTRIISVKTETTMLLGSGEKMTGGTCVDQQEMGHDGESWEGL